MKIAFVDNLPVGGGLSRYSFGLCEKLLENYPDLNIDYYIHYDNIAKMQELQRLPRLKIIILKATKPLNTFERFIAKIKSKLGINISRDKLLQSEIEKEIGEKYNLAYYPTAHMSIRPNLAIPVVGTFHDFNWKYFFGSQIFDSSILSRMESEMVSWMQNSFTITLSDFILEETKKIFPNVRSYPKVIHVGSLIPYSDLSIHRADQLLAELDIDYPYIIFPGNFFPHKNHLNLFAAFHLLKMRNGFEDYKLILTGVGTDQLKWGLAQDRGVLLGDKNNYNIRGLGYLSNENIDALILKAMLLVSPSIYECHALPAMDAWAFGTPTALSDIPPFKEHVRVLGIKSAFFNPMDPKSIADVLEAYLNNYQMAKEDALFSKQKIQDQDWKKVSAEFMSVFEKAIALK
jgi:glycosyltransferase involved in cell wall biosynthesis